MTITRDTKMKDDGIISAHYADRTDRSSKQQFNTDDMKGIYEKG